MLEEIKKVEEFHKKFGIHIGKEVGDINGVTAALRATLIKEEAKEVNEAIWNEPIENITKELSDLVYVTLGTVISYGLQDKFVECFNEVHKNNMSKLGEDGKPKYREDGKLIKPDNYTPVDLKPILENGRS